MKRLAEDSDAILNWLQANLFRQIRINTCGNGYYLFDKDFVLNKMLEGNLCELANLEDQTDIYRWIDMDMVVLEEKRGFYWETIRAPKGHSFKYWA